MANIYSVTWGKYPWRTDWVVANNTDDAKKKMRAYWNEHKEQFRDDLIEKIEKCNLSSRSVVLQ